MHDMKASDKSNKTKLADKTINIKFPPHLDPFCQVNYLHELSSGYPNYSTQK